MLCLPLLLGSLRAGRRGTLAPLHEACGASVPPLPARGSLAAIVAADTKRMRSHLSRTPPAAPAGDAVPPALLDKREARIRRMFADIAPRYDLLNHLLSLN